ncbi:DUF1566 domain-containing protein [Uliginosibacterium sediminicola]|uniref:DUF1566 domain-containing protein n=1 Tax=Uliginosibacterium sediminicola TaxID=2024550 RepID=A0ABU9YVY4_9RHOO
MQQLQIPPLSDGEIYIGAIGDQNGSVHHIILLPGDNDDATFAAALAWAKSIGGDLPTRVEQAMLWERHRDQLQGDWYWSSETHHRDDSSAWYQGFTSGTQGNDHKTNTLRARAVRRLPFA